MNTKQLLEETRDFLSTALSRFRCGEPASHDRNYRHIPEATIRDFITATRGLDNTLVLDIASLYGEEFGLWVADKNPSSEVHVYNPECLGIAEFLFNDLRPDVIFKLKSGVDYDANDPEGSINKLYRANGLDNVQYHYQAVFQDGLERVIGENQHRPVVIFSNRVPTQPKDLAKVISDVVGRYANAEMVLCPFVDHVDAEVYSDDNLVASIADNVDIRKGQSRVDIADIGEDARARTFLAMSQYMCLKAADAASGNVYRVTQKEQGFPYHKPCFIVSTLEPKE